MQICMQMVLDQAGLDGRADWLGDSACCGMPPIGDIARARRPMPSSAATPISSLKSFLWPYAGAWAREACLVWR